MGAARYEARLVTGCLCAVMGWLLIIAPHGDRGKTALNQWMKMRAYDAREACEAEITLHRSGAHLTFPNRGEVAITRRAWQRKF